MAKKVIDPTCHYRTLGKTGERVSAIGIGGWYLGLPKVDEQLAIRIVRTAISLPGASHLRWMANSRLQDDVDSPLSTVILSFKGIR